MRAQMLQKAAERIRGIAHCTIALLDEQGFPSASTISCVRTEGLRHAWFATGLSGDKAGKIRRDNRASICFTNGRDNISLTGTVEVLTDERSRRACWIPGFEHHFAGIDDPNYCILRFTASAVNLWLDGQSLKAPLAPEPPADSRCGLECASCDYRERCGCGGCVETDGHPFHGECPVAMCCQARGHIHCGECECLPCDKLIAYSYQDAEHGDTPPGARIARLNAWSIQQGYADYRLLLTSGSPWTMEGEPRAAVLDAFLSMLGKPPSRARVLFISAAVTSEHPRRFTEVIKRELLALGVLPENLADDALARPMKWEDVRDCDVLFVMGGDTYVLWQRMRETGFDELARRFINAGGLYLGVSAGSLVAMPSWGGAECAREGNGLALARLWLDVHCRQGKSEMLGGLMSYELTDAQAVRVTRLGSELIG